MLLYSYTLVDVFNSVFFFNDTATTEIYTLSLHDALPIWAMNPSRWQATTASRPTTAMPTRPPCWRALASRNWSRPLPRDRKSTRLNSSHGYISYAVFCLKKKKPNNSHAHSRHNRTH